MNQEIKKGLWHCFKISKESDCFTECYEDDTIYWLSFDSWKEVLKERVTGISKISGVPFPELSRWTILIFTKVSFRIIKLGLDSSTLTNKRDRFFLSYGIWVVHCNYIVIDAKFYWMWLWFYELSFLLFELWWVLKWLFYINFRQIVFYIWWFLLIGGGSGRITEDMLAINLFAVHSIFEDLITKIVWTCPWNIFDVEFIMNGL